MPHPALSAAITRIGRAARPVDPTTDGQLLARFARTRDESVFTELVRRLGPMVLGVCRRVAGDAHLAEDAFQAAFLVLARRAADVRPPDAVRGWVYGVAVRTAREARAVSARRRTREVVVPVVPDRPAEPIPDRDADALRVLDEEVAGLPDHLRAVVVLCELDGVGRQEAAARLGIPAGTVSSRLAKARKVLARRLRGRGVALPAAGLAVAGRATAVPPQLVHRTAALAASSAAVPPDVAALSQGVFRAMFFRKLVPAAACGLVLAVVAGSCLPMPAMSAQDPSKPPPAPGGASGTKPADGKKPAAASKPAGPGSLLVSREGDYWVMTPDGKIVAELAAPEGTESTGLAYFSPDATRVALVVVAQRAPQPRGADQTAEPSPFKVVVRKPERMDAGVVWDLPAHMLSLCWTADGKQLVVAKQTDSPPAKTFENLLLDPATGKTVPLDLPAGVRVLDCARDGRTFLVEAYDPSAKTHKLGQAAAGDKEVRELADLGKSLFAHTAARLSPDGTKVLFVGDDPGRKNAHKWGTSQRPYLLDVATKKRKPLPDFPENGRACGVAWSPDGKRIAYTWAQLHDELLKKDMILADDTAVETEAFLIVADADGRNSKTAASDKGRFALNMILGGVDWR